MILCALTSCETLGAAWDVARTPEVARHAHDALNDAVTGDWIGVASAVVAGLTSYIAVMRRRNSLRLKRGEPVGTEKP